MCREVQQRGNFDIWSPSVGSTLGYAYLLAGRVPDAVKLLEDAVSQATSMKAMYGHSLRLAYLGEAALADGRIDDARRHAQHALDVSRSQHERGHEAYALRVIAEITARDVTADVQACEAAYAQASALAEELGMRPLLALCRFGLGTLHRRTGKNERAHASLAATATMARDMGMTLWLEQAEMELMRW
jgi:tetratricopeptide (TPR) repeat protein